MINKTELIKEHKQTFVRSVWVSVIITSSFYAVCIIFVDYLGMKFSMVGIFTIPLTFIGRYTLNKYWVFK